MNESMTRIRVTIDRMRGMTEALESLADDLMEKNPKLFSMMAESPLVDLSRMQTELEGLLTELRQVPVASAS